ncbi:MAG TPA: type II secretion system protein GspG [Phycisphaerae bacterium]|nr:type II secretion system protein GspG [Phycisphaerae bacterium]
MSQQPVPYSSQAPRQSNGLGVAGFVVSLVGIFTAGVLCPIGLLLSFFALFRRPRGFAIAGFIVGLLGTAFLAVWLAFFGFVTLSCINFGKPLMMTMQSIQHARTQVEGYATGHMGMVPNEADGNALVGVENDGWGHPLKYVPTGARSYEISSAGQDGIWGTADDQRGTFMVGGP